jgi:hypothetical protein
MKTPLLALVFGIGIEILLYVFAICFDNIQSPLLERCLLLADDLPYRFSTWCNAGIWSWSYSSDPRMAYTDFFFDFLFGAFQWSLISLVAISLYRHYHKKHHENTGAA